MRRAVGRGSAGLLLVAAALAVSGCARRTDAPAPGASRGAVPSLLGVQVMLLPVQARSGIAGNADAELADALAARGEGVRWLMPPALRTMLARSPALDVSLDALPVGVFFQAQVDRIGDPLFGQLRRLAALADGRVALIPIQVRHRADSAERPGAVEVVATLIDATSGRVLWYGVVEGEAGGSADPRALASAADALARFLFVREGG